MKERSQMYRPRLSRDLTRPQDYRLSDYMSKPHPSIASANQMTVHPLITHSGENGDTFMYPSAPPDDDPDDPWVLRDDAKIPHTERLRYYNDL